VERRRSNMPALTAAMRRGYNAGVTSLKPGDIRSCSMTNTTVPPSAPMRTRLADAISKMWWVLLARGIALTVLGLYALFMPAKTLEALVALLAFFAIFDGVLAVLASIMGGVEARGRLLVRGLLCMLIGVFVAVFALPIGLFTAGVIAVIIAIQILIAGILEIMIGINHRREMEGEGWLIFGGILSIILGSLMLASPLLTARMLVRIAGTFAIFFGVILISNAFRARRLGQRLAAQ
jgi:uncharacterized membrane protein HdeD (DUF308 family)